ncbi:hypothetical protein [Bordetella sp. N]|uniref:hypothetical protein n=1 Tax=Bordetella sp. N TaxID=1746199 RepID=UPI0007103767|nr:hypothetical protein [Bordetella sp. N]ALM86616.1 hypothetical protein ASB57_30100 [Bordetella sp. N]
MNYSVPNDFRIINPALHGAGFSPATPIDGSRYDALQAAAHDLDLTVLRGDAAAVDPGTLAAYRNFDVTVQRGANTAQQLDSVLEQVRREIPGDKFAVQEINVSGVAFSGGAPGHLSHNQALATRNEDYVRQHLLLGGLKPELGINLRRKKDAEFPGLAPQGQSDSTSNWVRISVVYRPRTEDELVGARGDGGKVGRCSRRSAEMPPLDGGGGGLLSGTPGIPGIPGGDKPWLRHCPVRMRA